MISLSWRGGKPHEKPHEKPNHRTETIRRRSACFILMSTILVFTSLVEVIVTSTLARGDRLEMARRIDIGARLVFPVAFILLSLYALVI